MIPYFNGCYLLVIIILLEIPFSTSPAMKSNELTTRGEARKDKSTLYPHCSLDFSASNHTKQKQTLELEDSIICLKRPKSDELYDSHTRMANNSEEPSTAPEPGQWYNIKLGPSFNDNHHQQSQHSPKFCTLRCKYLSLSNNFWVLFV